VTKEKPEDRQRMHCVGSETGRYLQVPAIPLHRSSRYF